MKNLLNRIQSLFTTHPKLAELFRFAFTGGVCFVVEFLCLTLMADRCRRTEVTFHLSCLRN